MKLGELIKSYRKEHELTMQEFATKAGLSKGYVSMLERNQHPQSQRPLAPSLETYQKVASAMSLSLDELITVLDGDEIVHLEHSGKDYSFADFKEYNISIKFGDSIVLLERINKDVAEEKRALRLKKLCELFMTMNEDGQKKIVEYTDDLALSNKYKQLDLCNSDDKPISIAAHKRTDIEVTDEMLEHDMKIMQDDDF